VSLASAPSSEASAQARRLRLPARPGSARRPPFLVRFAAILLLAAADCALVASVALIIRGVDPISVEQTPDWYRDTLGSLLLALSLAGAASFTTALRRWGVPIVAVLCLVALVTAAVILLWGSFNAVLVSGIPAIVAAVVALLILALPPIRHRLED
jgi:hypothetical protein